ncbi:MAG: VCBS domain-containing protein [Myxococcales bacterium]|nr:VCBS domain-containing protein [Myxococcales bacterium]
MPEAQQALQNGVFELVVVEVDSAVAAAAEADVDYDGAAWLSFAARCKGTAANGLHLVLTAQTFKEQVQAYELRVRDQSGEDIEVHRNLSPFVGSPRWIGAVLDAADSLVTVAPPTWLYNAYGAPENLTTAGSKTTVVTLGSGNELVDVLVVEKTDGGTPGVRFQITGDDLIVTRDPGGANEVLLTTPKASPGLVQAVLEALAGEEDLELSTGLPAVSDDQAMADGVDASTAEYINALDQLVDVSDVDMVIASLQDLDVDRAALVYGAVIAHCEVMSADAKGRLGFGQVPVGSTVDEDIDLVGSLVSDRFALFAPYGVLGAAVGRIGSLPYFHSPTFKGLAGLGILDPALRLEEQRAYLKAKIVPVAELPGRGNVVVRGITTDGDQINVRRVADRAVRGVKQIGELFIGKLNTENGRNALKQKLNEFLLQMASESAIVPSTDGTDPAFKLDVYSTQADFALGIVRVDLALRPVRAIDYIYATVLVQV